MCGHALISLANKKKTTKLGPELKNRVEKALVGGGVEKSNEVAHALVLFYLRQLINDLNGFDSDEDEDYKYYESLSYLVAASCQSVQSSAGFYNNLQAILFDNIPKGNITVDTVDDKSIIPNASYKSSVAFVGRQVALHTCGLRTGEINSLGNMGIFTKEIATSYIQIKREMKVKSFDIRIKLLISKLRNILVSYINNPPTRLNFLGVNFHALAQARKERNISRAPSSVVVKPTRKSTSMTMGNLIARNARNARNVGQSSLVSAAQTRARGGKTRKSGRKSGRKTRKAGRKN